MARDAVIRIRVTSSEKEKMREFVESEKYYSGFSDYFRTTIKSDMDGELRGGADVDTSAIVDEIVDEIEPIQTGVKNLDEKMSVVMESVQESDDEIVELATELRELLPVLSEPPDDLRYENLVLERNKVTPESDIETVHRVSDAESWSVYLDESVQACERALIYLEKYYPSVVKTEVKKVEDSVGITIDTVSRYFVLGDEFDEQPKLRDIEP